MEGIINCQATVADGFKIALIELDEKLAGLAQIVHIMHDEIIVEVKEDVADHVAAVAKECMEGTFAVILPNVAFVVNPEIGDTWGEIVKMAVMLEFDGWGIAKEMPVMMKVTSSYFSQLIPRPQKFSWHQESRNGWMSDNRIWEYIRGKRVWVSATVG